MKKISIITINYNNLEGLKVTAKSIIEQNNKNFEWIVIDGGSNDGSKEYIESISEHIDYWVSEPDKGIYNAMNKGTAKATGEYCWYINSGDSIYDNDTVDNLLKTDLHGDVITGTATIDHNGVVVRVVKARPADKITLKYLVDTSPFDKDRLVGSSIMHQATLIKRDLVTRFPYDEKYRIASDYKLWLVLFIQENVSYQPIDLAVCHFDNAGCSSNPKTREETSMIIEEVMPSRILSDYKEFCRYKYSKIFRIAKKIMKISKRC